MRKPTIPQHLKEFKHYVCLANWVRGGSIFIDTKPRYDRYQNGGLTKKQK